MMIDPGSTARVHYKGTLADGTVFDSSEGRDPIEFEIGAGSVIPGFEKVVAEMDVEESRTVTIPCAEAYGERRDEMVGQVELTSLPEEITPEVGMMLTMQTPDGDLPVRIVALDETTMTIDANHPLAGEDLTFELTLVGVD